jgi:glycosyltransferase involved in cell wall biosynthesis
VVVDMARTFAAEGHFVVVMSPSNGPVRFELEQLGVPVIMDSRVLGGGESFAHVARNFDVVVCNTVVTWRAVATLGSDPDCFWYLHEVELLLHMVRSHPELAQVIRNTTSILAGSDRVRDTLKEYRSDVTVLEYGVEIPPRGLAAARRAAQASASASRVVCGIFGSYEPRKGQDLMVKAVREMPEELRANCEFRFYGRVLDPVFFSALRDIARETPSVTLHTEISLEEYFERMAECHLIVVPSRDDTLPLVSLHALAFGKPLVCTLSTGTSNYLSHMRSGILIAANTPSAIAQALFDAWSARERWPEIGEGGRAVFQQNFRPERFRRRLLDIVVAEDEPAGVRTAHAPLSA